jgi:transcriptional regulator with XRE-family HTH domain
MILSANLRERRKILGISQEKLAELADVTTQTINNIECCRSWVSDSLMLKLAEALGVEVFQLFVPGKRGIKKSSASPAAALLKLRQEIKTDLGAYISSCIDSRFSRFLNTETPNMEKNR